MILTDGKTTGNRLRLTRFLPVNLVFVAAFAALKVSFPGACPGKDIFYYMTGTTTEFAHAFSVVFPSFSERGLTGENARANAVSRRALSPVKIRDRLFPDMRREKTP